MGIFNSEGDVGRKIIDFEGSASAVFELFGLWTIWAAPRRNYRAAFVSVLLCLPSCWPRRWLERADGGKDLAEDAARYRDLRQLESDLARMSHTPCTDHDETALDARERPVSSFFWQYGTSKKAAKVVGQYVKLEPDLIVPEPLAGEPRPVDRVFAFFNVLLDCAALIVEMDDPIRLHRQVGDDKTCKGKQITRHLTR